MSVPTTACGALIRATQTTRPATLDDLTAPGGAVLVLAPHPDDETLGCGAAIVAALAAGRSVGIALLTDGNASHPNSRQYPPDALGALRRQEFANAVSALEEAGRAAAGGRPSAGVATLTFALPDASVPQGERAPAVVDGIVRFAETLGARTLWCTWRGDPHCDHQAAATIADLVEARLRADGAPVVRRDYAVWGRFGEEMPPAGVDLLPFPLGGHDAAKAAAMAHYASQFTGLIDDDPDGFVMPPALLDHFATHPEIFVGGEP